MAINKPILAAGSTLTRAEAKTVVLSLPPVAPPASYRSKDEDNFITIVDQIPTTEGAIVCYQIPNSRFGELYVTVNIDGILTWVPVSPRTVISDAATGKAWDPLANQYSILAY